MSKSPTITVTAAPGRVVPIHASTASGLGGKQLRITERDVVTLPNNVSVRRRLLVGDLIEVKATQAATASPKKKEN